MKAKILTARQLVMQAKNSARHTYESLEAAEQMVRTDDAENLAECVRALRMIGAIARGAHFTSKLQGIAVGCLLRIGAITRKEARALKQRAL